MKKAIAGAVLAGLTLRLAVLAGAGEAVGAWLRELDLDSRTVTAALAVELGGLPPAERTAPAAEGGAERLSLETPEPLFSPLPQEEEAAQIPAAAGAAAETAAEEAPKAEENAPAPAAALLSISGGVSIHNRTAFAVDPEALAAEGPGLSLVRGEPQVLIIHTHSSEAYTQDEYDQYEASDPYRTEDKSRSVIRVGDVLAEQLEAHGLTVLHDRELYDYPSYTGSYSRSGASVERYLAEYPSIRVVLDVHRDAIGSGDAVYKTLAALDGRSSAQVMLLVGTGENGLWHPNWRENLKLAMYLQTAAESRWPTLARPIELVSERYNQHLSPGSLILEVGSTGNTLREALLAAELFGDAAGEALAACMEG